MTSSSSPVVDAFADLVNADTQRLAARMAQDLFAGIFRQLAAVDGTSPPAQLGELETRCANWCQAAGSDAGAAARMALLVSGLDQWGLAYSQTFGLTAIPALSALLGALRNRLDSEAEARFQDYFARLERIETAGIDFKIELRRSIHLALWHAMAACENDEQANAIVTPLGSLLLALDRQMPELGWRLIADALASIQVSLLNGDVSNVAQNGTQQLFAALQHALPHERYRNILASSTQAILAWQQAHRAGHA